MRKESISELKTGSQQSASSNERRERLIKAGILRQGEGSPSRILKQTPIAVKTSILAALMEERAGSR